MPSTRRAWAASITWRDWGLSTSAGLCWGCFDSSNWSARPVRMWGWTWTLWQRCQTGGCGLRYMPSWTMSPTLSMMCWSNTAPHAPESATGNHSCLWPSSYTTPPSECQTLWVNRLDSLQCQQYPHISMLALNTQCTERTYCLYFKSYFILYIFLIFIYLYFLLLHGAIVTNTTSPGINKVFLILLSLLNKFRERTWYWKNI